MVATIKASYGFFLVVTLLSFSFWHMYYALGIKGTWNAGLIMYRLGFLADFSFDEMSGLDGTYTQKGDLLTYDDPPDDYDLRWWTVRAIGVLVSTWLAIALMNIFIAERRPFDIRRSSR